MRILNHSENPEYDSYHNLPDTLQIRADYRFIGYSDYRSTARLSNFKILSGPNPLSLPQGYKLYLKNYQLINDSLFQIKKIQFSIDKLNFFTHLSNRKSIWQYKKDIEALKTFKYNWFFRQFIRLKLYFAKGTEQYILPEVQPIMEAMLLNHTVKLDWETKNQFYDSGLYHLLVISGLHFGIIFLFFKFCLYFFPGYKRKNLIIILFLTLYLILVGFKSSVFRAYFMFTIYLIGELFDKKIDKFHLVWFSAFILLLFNPELLQNIGFQLTYLATLGILIGNNCSNFLFKDLPRYFYRFKIYFLIQTILMMLFLIIFILPILNYHFGIIHLFGYISNLCLSVVVTFFISAGFLFLFFTGIPFLNSAFAGLVNFSGKIFLLMVNYFSTHPMIYYKTRIFTQHDQVILYYLILCAIIFFAWMIQLSVQSQKYKL